jgi:hypothetical protein
MPVLPEAMAGGSRVQSEARLQGETLYKKKKKKKKNHKNL